MKLKIFALTILLATCVFSQQDEIENEEEEIEVNDSVIVLNEDNFDSTIKTNNYFIMFYAPWCHHCVKLKPVWNQLAEEFNTRDESKVGIAKVDCTKNKKICSDLDVSGYPTLLWLESGFNVEKYRGQRALEDLKIFIELKLEGSKANEDALSLNPDSFKEFIKSRVTFVKFYAPWCGYCKRMMPTWGELATKFADDERVKIGKIDCTLNDENRELCTKEEVRGFPTIFIYKDGAKVAEYDGNRSLKDMYGFVMIHLSEKTRDEL